MFTKQGPTVRELAVQALSSTERGYDLLAPKFDRTPYRTPDRVLDAVTRAVRELGPFDSGLDVCCGTGAGVGVLRRLCRERAVGVDFSAGMLAEARAAFPPGGEGPAVHWVRADARSLPFAPAFDLALSFGAFGHFLPAERFGLFAEVHGSLRPGGRFVFPIGAPPPVGSRAYWSLFGFDAAMRVRNALWRPRFVMYYRTFPLGDVLKDLTRAGFAARLLPLTELGVRPDGSPRARLVVATREGPA
ncbi:MULTISPECIES: class I SAM-dependent methyltransferase [Streptomyces]|uniref:Methyltransferase n=1 Tax=Streptomyces griseus subsp. griseus (strain JCM 4626 / CBS 651.72 / NBRC 13350 / KCC S-0626 / ISP 5235) TaxID=455632 RepID=B1VLE3_STRGG|nr:MULTISPECIES: class I SAM-dependent methyltransferase [Streptomyces]MYR09356.1 methyltransferase domain-containing protein [Streptomyces sp. SID724]MYR54157.1 methyltransferase domain-containing protein [Streptomyces sp. SID4928]EGE46145.1 Methyltransferase type 11 [Streptomyces sp. ACT-1]MBW3709080.1 class I SAM-dependent methyltransferase [Streptomyces griseus]SCD93353.1 Methyltransferase domain-containing protein [Streptomyces sp. OspMP-M43]